MMEGTEGALTPNRLICCPTTSTTFDLVCIPLTKVVSLPVVADYSGSNYRFCSKVWGLCYKISCIHFGDRKSWLSVTSGSMPNMCETSFTIIQEVAETPGADQTNAGKPKQTNKKPPLQSALRGRSTAEPPPQT